MSIENLQSVLDALRRYEPDSPVTRWFHYSVQGFLLGDPLDDAFDLRPLPGGRDPRTVYWLAERDKHLRVA